MAKSKAGSRPMDGYIRVSRRLGREGPGYISPDVQREAIERWAAYKDVEVDEWHVDEDWSGGTHERPGLERAIERATASETGGIVSWKIDRFSRYTEGGLRDLRRLEEAGARLAFVVEDIDTSGPMGKFVYTVMLAMGGKVNGGLYGTAPSLNPDPSNPTLENNAADVRFETDFRSVYARVLDQWLGADSRSILGGDFRANLTFV